MKVKVNVDYDFDINISNENVIVNGDELVLDSRNLASGHTHIIHDNKSYRVEVIAVDRVEKACQVKVNGKIYQANISDQFDELLKKMGMDSGSAGTVRELKAPMPGLVLRVAVAEGQEIIKGDSLLVLEAMKMENSIKSPTSGKINKILVNTGDKVEKNQVLVLFE
jgi:biotin carboxyl carrier protein